MRADLPTLNQIAASLPQSATKKGEDWSQGRLTIDHREAALGSSMAFHTLFAGVEQWLNESATIGEERA